MDRQRHQLPSHLKRPASRSQEEEVSSSRGVLASHRLARQLPGNAGVRRETVLALQRTVGNRAVTRMLASRSNPARSAGATAAERSSAYLSLSPRIETAPSGVPAIQRALHLTGADADVQRLLALLGQASGLTLQWNNANPLVTAALPLPKKRNKLAKTLLGIIKDKKRTAKAHVLRNRPDVNIGAFPMGTPERAWPAEDTQLINLDHLDAFEQALAGLGVAMGAHEVYENYIAQHKRGKSDTVAKAAGHKKGLELESWIEANLYGIGKRVSTDVEPQNPDAAMRAVKVTDANFDPLLFAGQPYYHVAAQIRYQRKTVRFDQFMTFDPERVVYRNIQAVDANNK